MVDGENLLLREAPEMQADVLKSRGVVPARVDVGDLKFDIQKQPRDYDFNLEGFQKYSRSIFEREQSVVVRREVSAVDGTWLRYAADSEEAKLGVVGRYTVEKISQQPGLMVGASFDSGMKVHFTVGKAGGVIVTQEKVGMAAVNDYLNQKRYSQSEIQHTYLSMPYEHAAIGRGNGAQVELGAQEGVEGPVTVFKFTETISGNLGFDFDAFNNYQPDKPKGDPLNGGLRYSIDIGDLLFPDYSVRTLSGLTRDESESDYRKDSDYLDNLTTSQLSEIPENKRSVYDQNKKKPFQSLDLSMRSEGEKRLAELLEKYGRGQSKRPFGNLIPFFPEQES